MSSAVVKVLVDKDGGVSLDDIAEATRDVSAALDSEDVLGADSYTLEVTSPGVGRPLTAPRHWRRNVDRLVKVTRHTGEAVTGRIVEVGEASATLDVAGARTQLPYSDVAKARIEIEFNRPATSPRRAAHGAGDAHVDGNDGNDGKE
jgi:ribosome maturation factor RimP